MLKSKYTVVIGLMVLVAVIYLGGFSGGHNGIELVSTAAAQGAPEISPVKARARSFYAPNTEDLAPDEMRLTACGTVMPTARPKHSASCCML